MQFPPQEVIDKLLPGSFIHIPENRKSFVAWLSTLGIKDDISEDEEELEKYRARLPEFRIVTREEARAIWEEVKRERHERRLLARVSNHWPQI